jgi:transposase InsO family protein
MTSHVKRFVKACHSCQANKPSAVAPAGLLQPLPVPAKPWESVSMDFITQLPACTDSGRDAIMVVVDRLTKMVHLIPMHTASSASQTAQLFLNNIFKHHGMPRSLISDRDAKFTSAFWKTFITSLGTSLNMSTAYHPQSDGQTERMNRTLEQILRHYINYHHDNWENFLPLVEFAMNNSPSRTTGFTPFYLNYGINPHTPLSLVADVAPEISNPTASELHAQWRLALEQAQVSMRLAQDTQAAYADIKRSKSPSYALGAKVMLNTAHINFKHAPSDKLTPRFIGPFKIKSQVSALAYKLDLPRSMKIHPVFHVSLLKPYHEDPINPAPIPPLPVIASDDEEEYEVEQILAKRTGRANKVYYLVRYKGYGPEEDEYLPLSHLKHCKELIADFESKLVSAAAPRRARR